ncbi:hypothetical protein NDU88_002584 [Pleurodeles waltl]|uniref:Uncharacterized protein n=1 Tax=Pleurodeles waltl TaxID=8319 RepID=A0AAV7W2T3_PLEWA|nr:hypothetical protein NDU88_002584 [Pleurodeles waltl]
MTWETRTREKKLCRTRKSVVPTQSRVAKQRSRIPGNALIISKNKRWTHLVMPVYNTAAMMEFLHFNYY